jgi:hypothetical protein
MMSQTTTRPTTRREPAMRLAQPTAAPAQSRGISAALRSLGAVALLAVGAVHLEQYFADDYRAVPVIGPLFVLNFAGATVLAIVLLVPLGRSGTVVHRLSAVAGIAVGLTSIAFLLISEHRTLFGFMEHGYRPPIVVALAAEGIAAVLLAAYLAVDVRGR